MAYKYRLYYTYCYNDRYEFVKLAFYISTSGCQSKSEQRGSRASVISVYKNMSTIIPSRYIKS
jgi:hypothetical protein